jgi:hypothetical protein
MELFKNIRLNAARRTLKKKVALNGRKFNYSSFINAKKIVLIWDASNTEDFVHLSKFHQKMQERKINVEILGYFDGKDLPDQLTAVHYLTLIRRKELNFFFIPVSNEANEFINKDFDVLIDLNFKKTFPLTYLSFMSKSGIKVGLLDAKPADTPFDLMLELKDNVNVQNFLIQSIQYLEMINNEKLKTKD